MSRIISLFSGAYVIYEEDDHAPPLLVIGGSEIFLGLRGHDAHVAGWGLDMRDQANPKITKVGTVTWKPRG